MNSRFFPPCADMQKRKNLAAWCVAIFAFFAKHLFPTLSVLYGTKKENKYAWLFLPSVKKQRAIARLLSNEAIEARVWDIQVVYFLISYQCRGVFLSKLNYFTKNDLAHILWCFNTKSIYLDYAEPFLEVVLPLLEDDRLRFSDSKKLEWLSLALRWVGVMRTFLLTNQECVKQLNSNSLWKELRSALLERCGDSMYVLWHVIKNLKPTVEEDKQYKLVECAEKLLDSEKAIFYRLWSDDEGHAMKPEWIAYDVWCMKNRRYMNA